MRAPSKLLLALAVALPASYATAFAQSVGVEVYSGPSYGYGPGYYYSDPDDFVERGPRVYGYRSEAPETAVILRPSNCGQYRYWNGNRCADARITPPDLN